MLPINTNDLKHWGVKGMRWGVINEDKTGSNRPSSTTEKEYNKKFSDVRKQLRDKGLNEEALKSKYGEQKPNGALEFVKDHKVGIAVGVAAAASLGYLYVKGKPQFSSMMTAQKAYENSVDGLNLNWDKGVTLAPGSIIKRVSTVAETQIRPEGFYGCHLESDVKAYKGILPGFWAQWGIGSINNGGYVNHYQALKEVKAPSGSETLGIYKDLMKKDSGFMVENLLRMPQDAYKHFKSLDDISEEGWKAAFSDFALNWCDRNSKSNEIFFSAVKSRGYNALIDFNDAGKLGKTPLRIIDSSVFKIVKNEPLPLKEILKCLEEFTPELVHQTLVPNELYHWGVKGMRWGIRRKSPEEVAKKYDAKAAKYEKAASRFTDKRASDSTMLRRIVMGGYQAVGTKMLLDMYGKDSIKKSDIINNMLFTQLVIRNPKKSLEFKAETARRKADKIRNKQLKGIDKTKSKKSFEDRVNSVKEALKEPYNQEKAKRLALNTALAASLIYQNRQALKLVAGLGLNVATQKVREKRARDMIPALPKKASPHKIQKMKPNKVYLVDPSGKLKKAGKFEVL